MSENELSALTVLIIEDQKGARNLLRKMLHDLGIDDVLETEDGDVALKLLRGDGLVGDKAPPSPDLIISDLYMDRLDGGELCNTLRRDRDEPGHGIPMLIVTGERDRMVHNVLRQMGAVDVMVKPVSPAVLREKICKAVGFAL